MPTAFAAEGQDRVKFAFRDYDSFSSSTKSHVNFIDTNGKRKEAVSKSATDSCRREKCRVKFASFDLEMLFLSPKNNCALLRQ